jgi:hypothetical protein
MELDLSVQAFEWLLAEWGEDESASAGSGSCSENAKPYRFMEELASMFESAGDSGKSTGRFLPT